ncbi:hypothetical protein GMPD_11610 [Geomonas paludis]|uniref:Uncharacterized protein n=1 Tax=Geomonas paludis TaxID=2740185 RepID=A0A6V8MT69_9BACT|nr:hypothetical protein GMPD_11610 [Geomonas paludis]
MTVPSKKGPSRTAGSYFKGGFSVNDSHPDVHLRVNGIMGANGDIREALGCGSVKGSFVECTLEGRKW